VIAGAATHFQKRRVSILMEPGVLVSIIEALVVAFPLPQLPALLVEATVLGLLLELFLRKLSSRMFSPTSL
jgi:hypothetical protein